MKRLRYFICWVCPPRENSCEAACRGYPFQGKECLFPYRISRMIIASQSRGFGRVSFDLSIWGSSHFVISLPLKQIQLFFFSPLYNSGWQAVTLMMPDVYVNPRERICSLSVFVCLSLSLSSHPYGSVWFSWGLLASLTGRVWEWTGDRQRGLLRAILAVSESYPETLVNCGGRLAG